MRISDWSSDVCSSDLRLYIGVEIAFGLMAGDGGDDELAVPHAVGDLAQDQLLALLILSAAYDDERSRAVIRQVTSPLRCDGSRLFLRSSRCGAALWRSGRCYGRCRNGLWRR